MDFEAINEKFMTARIGKLNEAVIVKITPGTANFGSSMFKAGIEAELDNLDIHGDAKRIGSFQPGVTYSVTPKDDDAKDRLTDPSEKRWTVVSQ